VALRDGRLKKGVSGPFAKLNPSISFDRKLYREDIRGSRAWARALNTAGFLDKDELAKIENGLTEIEEEIESGKFRFSDADEDIHMNVERRLQEKIGKPALKLHTGRSRNEQVVLDERLYLIARTDELREVLETLLRTLAGKAKLHLSTIIPAYTHLRHAQPVSLAHLFLAYCGALQRGKSRIGDFEKRLKVLPLGSGAVAGSSIPIDRGILLRELPFDTLSSNSIDAIATRDFIAEFEFICLGICVTLSRMSEDFIIWSSGEFGFLRLPDELCTTSSLMPQKKNPDSLELIRGKTAGVLGSLVSIITLEKGLPYTYNRDLQEDKEPLFHTADSTILSVQCMADVIGGFKVDEERINRVLDSTGGALFATDIADYLVERGVPFREAHSIVGSIVRYCSERNISLSALSIEKYRSFSDRFDKEVYGVFDYLTSVNRHDVEGGTALKRVAEAIKRLEEELGA